MKSLLFERISHLFASFFENRIPHNISASQPKLTNTVNVHQAPHPPSERVIGPTLSPHLFPLEHIVLPSSPPSPSLTVQVSPNSTSDTSAFLSSTSSSSYLGQLYPNPSKCPNPLSPSPSVSSTLSAMTITDLKRTQRTEQQNDISKHRKQREQSLAATIASLFCRFCFGQAVVLGKLPALLPRAQIFAISEHQHAPPYCWRVRCRPLPEEWPTALALMGFDWRETTVWLLHLQHASDPAMLKQLKAVATLSAPCSVVLLMSWSAAAVQLANEAGFSLDPVQYGAPLYLLRRKERHARCDETDSPYTSPPYSPPPEPMLDGWVVKFSLVQTTLPRDVQHALVGGFVKVLGNCTALGNWKTDQGLRMNVRGNTLYAEVIIQRRDQAEYKYIVESKEGTVLWENGGNRRIPPENGICVRIEDRWRSS